MKKVSVIAATLLAIISMNPVSAASTNPNNSPVKETMKAAPPAAVLNSFISIFGNVPVRQWKLRSNGDWRAHFMNNGIAWEATFRPDGTLMKSERD